MLEGGSSVKSPNEKIGVIGLGYVGLPLALLCVENGFEVTGIDVDTNKIDKLLHGTSYLTDISNEQIGLALKTNRFHISSDYSLVSHLNTIIICVPTPLVSNHHPDLSFLVQAGTMLSEYIQKGQLVILESSTYPGTTKEVLQPLLEKSGLNIGQDIFLAYSPERIDPGNKVFQFSQVPKVLSGVTPNCSSRARKVYSQLFDEIVMVSTPETAELTKLVENTQRFVNISLMNEIAMFCEMMKINIWEVIEAASTKPYGFMPYYPGPGVGGHCIPVDPLYLSWKAKQYKLPCHFIDWSFKINQEVPKHIIKRVEELLQKRINEAQVLVYGVTYKRDINDTRESAAIPVLEHFLGKEASVSYHDPFVPFLKIGEHVLTSKELTVNLLQGSDCVIILTDHTQIPIEYILDYASVVVDTRNITKGLQRNAKVFRLGEG